MTIRPRLIKVTTGRYPKIRYSQPIEKGERVIFDGQVFHDEIIQVYQDYQWGGSSGGDSCVYFNLMNADNETDDGSLAARSRWTFIIDVWKSFY